MDIEVSGSWNQTIGTEDLTAGAGSDVVGTYQSPAAQVTASVLLVDLPTDTWRIDVRRVDSTWDPDVRVWVRRTGDGSGPGSVSGGTSYHEVTTSNAAFFEGAGNRSNIPIQIRITGIGVSSVAPDTLLSSFSYTVLDT